MTYFILLILFTENESALITESDFSIINRSFYAVLMTIYLKQTPCATAVNRGTRKMGIQKNRTKQKI